MSGIRRWLLPILWACGLVLLSWFIQQMPPQVSVFVRIANGFVIITLLMWVIYRVLDYRKELHDHRQEIMELMTRHELARDQSVQDLMHQTKHIASDLADKTDARADSLEKKLDVAIDAKKIDAAIDATLAKADSIEQKLDEVIQKGKNGHE